jgi:acyl-CoA dehydrogenase
MSTDPIDYGVYEAGRDCNYWELDPTLQYEAERVYPTAEFEWAEPVLRDYGEVLGHTIADNSDRIDRHGPELHTYDADGEVQNYVEYHPDQFENERITYEEFGLTHDPFHAPPGRDEPVGFAHTLMMQTLLGYCDTGFACPASMTTGAAIVLEKFDDGSLDDYFQALTARDYDDHVEGAMFLTEKQGGSDVGANEVRAEPQEDGTYELYGEKWFCSNVDAQGALALARTPGAPEGTKGLSLFLVPRELPDGELNDALFRRLKDKLGTIAVPTGEIEYRGATGYLVGEEGQGFKAMAEMMNYERLTNATGAVGVMGRALLESKVRTADREAFGNRIDQYPLMRRDLVEMTVDYEAAAAFSFEATRFYDEYKAEGETSDRAWKMMRLLVPIAKKETARKSVEVTSYAMEVLGGNGYVREHTTERLLRDAQVLPIWEGTSNILSLDLLRVLGKEQAHEELVPYVNELLDVEHPFLEALVETVSDRFTDLQNALVTLASEDDDYAQYHAKELATLTYDVVCAALLVSEAQASLDDGDARKALVAKAHVDKQFGVDDVRGITSGETFADDHFDAIARYAHVDPSELGAEPAPADD